MKQTNSCSSGGTECSLGRAKYGIAYITQGNMKASLTAPIISAIVFSGLIVSSIVGTLTVEVARGQTLPILPHTTYHSGDPYTTVYVRNVTSSPPNGTKPPIVRILSPANNSVVASNYVTLAFDLTPVASTDFYPVSFLVYYTTSWQSNESIFISNVSIPVMEIPEGPQWITVYAYAVSSENETGREYATIPNTPNSSILLNFLYIYSDICGIAGSSSVNFTINPSANEQSTQLPLPSGFSTVAGAIVCVTIVAGLLVYFKKHWRSLNQATEI